MARDAGTPYLGHATILCCNRNIDSGRRFANPAQLGIGSELIPAVNRPRSSGMRAQQVAPTTGRFDTICNPWALLGIAPRQSSRSLGRIIPP
jgi:hypothetical protein